MYIWIYIHIYKDQFIFGSAAAFILNNHTKLNVAGEQQYCALYTLTKLDIA